ncbi:putative protein for very long chain fatty acid elongation [Halotydeus destructor]|nr:putative protein for very long chain fatty acid elongation [Halotydeus destructor]
MGSLVSQYNEIIQNGDPRLETWPMMASPVPTLILTAIYLYFVKIMGPKWMENRKPFHFRNLMVVYNFSLVAISLYMFYEMGKIIRWGKYSFECRPVDYSNDPVALRMCYLGWLFLMTKYVEFADTVFFVLRKKQNQVTTLHVIHHSVVPISVWVAVKYASGGGNTLFPFLNTGVHTVMYLYYGLSALGPHMQKYLWWKKYLTTLQLTQFALVMALATQMVLTDCKFPKSFLVLNVFHAVLFFSLFSSFYRQSYKTVSRMRKGGLAVSTTSGPDGSSTIARIGAVTIRASVHYGRDEAERKLDHSVNSSTLAAGSLGDNDDNKLQ